MALSCRCFLFAVLVCCVIPEKSHSHSWLACTDYTEKNSGTWKPEKCRGFARGGHRKAPKNGIFGLDFGFNHEPTEDNPCQVDRNDEGEYNQDHPMAVYYPGQQVILVHPMKSHGADTGCTSVHIPDYGSWIYRSERNSSEDPSFSQFQKNFVFDLGRSPSGKDYSGNWSRSTVYPKPGYQNAPRFCDNTDKAVATYSFNVPKNLQPGRYTFFWLWAFNSATDLYSSCFEVEIVQDKSARNETLSRNGFVDTSEPCGGVTSNPDIEGNWNADCTQAKDEVLPSTPETPATTAAEIPSTESITTPTLDPTVESSAGLTVMLSQFSGEIHLPAPRSPAVRRHYSIDFGCDVDAANFWNCQTKHRNGVSAPNSARRHYEVVQEGEHQLQSLRIFYQVRHKEPCDIKRFPPVAKVDRVEYKNN